MRPQGDCLSQGRDHNRGNDRALARRPESVRGPRRRFMLGAIPPLLFTQSGLSLARNLAGAHSTRGTVRAVICAWQVPSRSGDPGRRQRLWTRWTMRRETPPRIRARRPHLDRSVRGRGCEGAVWSGLVRLAGRCTTALGWRSSATTVRPGIICGLLPEGSPEVR